MTVSSARRTRAIFALAAALYVVSAGAGAQTSPEPLGEPLRLGPPDSPPADDGAGARAQPADEAADAEAIEVGRLGVLIPEAIGVLDPGKGGFPADMWEGTPRHVVEALLSRIPGDLRSPVLRDLARRLLLSSAAPPTREHAGEEDSDLLKLRARRLARLGESERLLELLRVVPQRLIDAELARLRVEALFLTQRRAAACKQVRSTVAREDAAFWTKALAICQLAAGERDRANLSLALLREQGQGGDATFFALFDAAEQGAGPAPPAPALAPLHLALASATGLEMPAETVPLLSVGGLLAVSGNEASDPLLRARAAEEAAARGGLAAEALQTFYARFKYDKRRLASAGGPVGAGADRDLGPVRRRALLYQAALSGGAASMRAELVRDALSEADPALYLALARLFAPIVAGIEARAELVWFAETAGRALYAAGREKAAAEWLTLARQEAIINPAAAAAVTVLWPYARLAGATELPVNGGLAAWRSAQDTDDQAVNMRESVLRVAFQALGEREPRGWVEIAANGVGEARKAPPAALLFALENAGEGGRLGETVLLGLIVAGQTGLDRCHPLALGVTLDALIRVGLEAEARRLAIEAAVANGI